jgi:hypothetical protein
LLACLQPQAEGSTSVHYPDMRARTVHIPHAPVLSTKTTVAADPQQVRSMFAGVVQDATGMFGFGWFDLSCREAWNLGAGAVRQCSAEARSYR